MEVLSVSYNDPEAGAKFTSSIKETGFGVVTDHPVSADLINEAYQEWEAFFKNSAKQDYLFDKKNQSGYFPFRSENAKDLPIKDLKEFYHFYPWGTLPQGMTEKTRKLHTELVKFAGTLLGWIEDHTPEHVRSKFSEPLRDMIVNSPKNLLRILHYPPLSGDEEPGAIRAAAHEDINLITVLPAATAPGLQVLDNWGKWHNVQCDPGSIVVNSGDMLKMASGGYYGSTTHQVVNPMDSEQRKHSRYSMPLFLHPRPDVQLSPTHTADSYLGERLRELGLS